MTDVPPSSAEPVLALADGVATQTEPKSLVPTLQVDGEPIKLDSLGPVIVNEDGSLQRIANWHELSEKEQAVTLRRIPKRNKERLDAIAASRARGDSPNTNSLPSSADVETACAVPAASLQVGTRVEVQGRAAPGGNTRGMLAMDNEDGTWNVMFDDGTDDDIPAHQLVVGVRPDSCCGIRLVPKEKWMDPKPAGWTRFVCFSDTHGLHDKIPESNRPAGDVLLHAGDFTNTGELKQVESFGAWLAAYPCASKVVIAGNHDTTFDEAYYHRLGGGADRFHPRQPYDCAQARSLLVGEGGSLTDNGGAVGPNCTYLQDELAEVQGYTIYGSPWQPEFCDWAFNLPHGEDCAKKWSMIPSTGVDILMTHGPPFGLGDMCSHGGRAGCRDLMAAIAARPIAAHVSGHIHEGYGVEASNGILYVNASTCTHSYAASNPPVVFDAPPPEQMRQAAIAAVKSRQKL